MLERERFRDHDRERTRERELPQAWGARDLAAVRDVADFKAVRAADLAATHYGGRIQDIDKLVVAGYVKRHSFIDERVHSREVLVVTPKGRAALKRDDPERRIYHFRHVDLAHDADIYPAVVKVREQLEAEGATVGRVISGERLAAERARLANRPRGEWKRNPPATLKRQQEIAQALDLKVIDGQVLIPDARVPYIDRHGKERHVDVEVTTPNYSRAERAGKSKAGFHLVAGVSFTQGRKIFDDR